MALAAGWLIMVHGGVVEFQLEISHRPNEFNECTVYTLGGSLAMMRGTIM